MCLSMPKQLPDTPWHVGSPKMKESDHRRLNKWCVHYDSSFCTEPKSGCYMLKCAGSSHCKFYAEDDKASKKIERDNRTQMEIDAEHRRHYIATLKPKMQALVSSSDGRRYASAQALKNCFICGSKLLELGKHRKKCPLCHMEYIDKISSLSDIITIDGRFVYVMGYQKPEEAQEFQDKEKCQFCDSIGRCRDENSPLFEKRCKPRYCNNLKKHILRAKRKEESSFTGIKDIPLDKIIVRNMSPPRKSKLEQAIEMIRKEGKVTKPIYVELHKDKYLLKDGYIRYLAALHCGLYSVPATLEWECEKK